MKKQLKLYKSNLKLKKLCTNLQLHPALNYFPNGLINKIKDGSKVNTEIIANNIAIPVKIPKYIVGIKFDKTKIEKPKTIVIEVLSIALPTVPWQSFKVLL